MKSAAGLGAAFGALIGLIPAVALAALLTAFDRSLNSSPSDGVAGAYVVGVLLGGGIGAIVGLVSGVSGAAVARSASGDARSRRTKGAWTSAGVATAPMLLVSAFGPVLSIGIVLVAAVAWAFAWWALPRVVDLEPPVAEQLPAQYGEQPAAPGPPMSPTMRWLVIVVSAGLGGLLATNIVMSFVGASLPREAGDIIGFGLLAVSAAAIGFGVWRLTDRPSA